MDKDIELYTSWWVRGSYFNMMIDCGDMYNQWVENALHYLPIDVLNEYKEKLVFISTAQRDACRVARQYCENRELIILSDRILPKPNTDESQPEVRYFIYTVLHEVAHAIKNHKSPKFDNLSEEEGHAQEDEADEIAFSWFNKHVTEQGNPYLKPLTTKEIEDLQNKNQDLMKKLLNGM